MYINKLNYSLMDLVHLLNLHTLLKLYFSLVIFYLKLGVKYLL